MVLLRMPETAWSVTETTQIVSKGPEVVAPADTRPRAPGRDAAGGRRRWRRPSEFRPPGAPAGAWHHTPWWHCVFYDPYERVNVWSHGLPGAVLVCLGIAAGFGGSFPMAFYCCAAAACHLFSAAAHVYPDDHQLEKLDHLGILVLLFATPYSLFMVSPEEIDLNLYYYITVVLVIGAFLPQVFRVLVLVVGGFTMVYFYWKYVSSLIFGLELLIHLFGAAFFIRGKGHCRMEGFADHHILHYLATSATCLHLYLLQHMVQG